MAIATAEKYDLARLRANLADHFYAISEPKDENENLA